MRKVSSTFIGDFMVSPDGSIHKVSGLHKDWLYKNKELVNIDFDTFYKKTTQLLPKESIRDDILSHYFLNAALRVGWIRVNMISNYISFDLYDLDSSKLHNIRSTIDRYLDMFDEEGYIYIDDRAVGKEDKEYALDEFLSRVRGSKIDLSMR